MNNLAEFVEIKNSDINIPRFQVIKFGLYQVYNYLFFGYGPGSFEILFQIKFPELTNSYANHAHSDLVQFLGEFGLMGLIFFFISILNFFFKLKYKLKNNLTET